MGIFTRARRKLLFLICLGSLSFSFAEENPVNPRQIPYLARRGDLSAALSLYREYSKERKHHDFELLSDLGNILLEEGLSSSKSETQVLSIFGMSIAGIAPSHDRLSQAMESRDLGSQLAAISFIAHMQDDRCDDLLIRAMSSPHFAVRLEAGHLLAMRKHRAACGQMESLMSRLPPFFHFLFPEFFAMIGSKEAIATLRQLIDHRENQVRIEAILSAARHGRDDLLPIIRAHATHPSGSEQEACAFALGALRDSKSLSMLAKLASSTSPNVRLAASYSLLELGENGAIDSILELAKMKNLQAIFLLGRLSEGEELLLSLLKDKNSSVRVNAGLALLQQKNPESLPVVEEILLSDSRDWGFQPIYTTGRALTAWKVIPSAKGQQKDLGFDIQSVTLSFREFVLRFAIELPQEAFLQLARKIFDTKQNPLIPSLVTLLQNKNTPEAIALLKDKAQKAGAPFIRSYCTLGLFRLGIDSSYRKTIEEWIDSHLPNEPITLRPIVPKSLRIEQTSYDLTPMERSRLLIEGLQAIADSHDKDSIDYLLHAIEIAHPKSRYPLAGLLLYAIQ